MTSEQQPDEPRVEGAMQMVQDLATRFERGETIVGSTMYGYLVAQAIRALAALPATSGGGSAFSANVSVIREMLDAEAENRAEAGGSMSDYEDEPRHALDALDNLVSLHAAERSAREKAEAELAEAREGLKFAAEILEEAEARLDYAPGSMGQIEIEEAIELCRSLANKDGDQDRSTTVEGE
jgi:hypothetical protein